MRPLGFEPGGDLGDVAELPNLDGGSDGQAVGRGAQGQTHRRLEGAEVGVHRPVLLADDDELAGLVDRHQQRDAELIEEGREVGGMNAAERRCRAGLSRSRWPGSSTGFRPLSLPAPFSCRGRGA